MKVLSLFSGIGAFEKALDNLGVPYELSAYCEIDKYASKSYAAIHGVSESLNLGDITKVDEKALPMDLDLVTYGFPCQDISIAGKQKGLIDEDGKHTRSGLFFEALRIIEETQPRVAIAENVKNLTGQKFKAQFELVLKSLEDAGYNNYWKVLNLKDFGIPQNRERVFIVSIRKDIANGTFTFPTGFPLEKRLKDMLEESVDERYYMSGKTIDCLTRRNEQNKQASTERVISVGNTNPSGHGMNGNVISEHGLSSTLTTNKGEGLKILVSAEPQVMQIGNCCPTKTRDNPNQGRIYDTNGIAPALNCMGGGNRQPCILADKSFVNGDVSKTIRAGGHGSVDRHSFDMVECDKTHRIRKLTPKECFRLMGFSDQDHAKAAEVNSNTQLYKQAGNSIGVPCVEYILMALIDCGALAI